MAIQQIDKDINGTKYVASTIPALKGMVILKDLSKLVLPALGEGIDNQAGISFSGMSGIFDKVVRQMDEVDLVNLIQNLFKASSLYVDGKEANIDDHFSAKYDELVDVAKWLIEENFQSFFTKARSLLLSMGS